MQSQPDALDRRFSLGLQDYDSTVAAQPGRGARPCRLGEGPKQSAGRSETLCRMGEAGRRRIERFSPGVW